MVDRVDAFAPDLIISAGFDHVIRSRLIAVPRHGIINVHCSLLPEYRGLFPVFWALRHRAPRMGASVHLIDSEKLDTGPVLEQQVVEPAHGESLMALDARIFRIGIGLAVNAIARLEKGDAAPRPQPPGAGSYHSYPAKDDVTALRATGRRLYTARDVVRLLRGDERPDRPCQHVQR